MTDDEVIPAPEHHDDGGTPDIGRAIGFGAAIGIAVAFVAVGGASLAAGYEWTTAVGLAVFASIWSGLGFGAMFGGIIYVTKLDALAEAERKARRTRAPDESTPGPGPRSTTLA